MISLTHSFNNMATTLDSDALPIVKLPLYVPDTDEIITGILLHYLYTLSLTRTVM